VCFSAEASFAGAAVVGGLGVATVAQVRSPRQIAYAALPLGFAAHQLAEGITWLRLDGHGATALHGWWVHFWVIYAWALLPLWLPLSIWLIEPDDTRRRRLLPLVVLGGLMLVFMLAGALRTDIEVRVIDSNLDYVLPFGRPVLLALPYVVTTCVSGLLSSFKWVRVFGAANLVALSLAALIKAADFSSLWCTFAAFLSVIILLHFREQRRLVRGEPASAPT
jgi:Family of unknown function (DUF6629)